ncbi:MULTISPECIES: type I secretion system permease/ATPase [unclassified Oleiphilus]|uniref:type I secretion system permease/ATPase n=2 Tax=Oleiphilus TaxID=141450 RepID=UPI0007C2B402|nr:MULTISPECIES: type I secretion system permease/ATPase [unclassified Oleiphilus]KZY31007.1 hypothetical protein A3729_10005 [Oleiphilus sp. HI0043]KZZ62322.1 hypothetical protein A3763_08275 [Oleiphilus sp. HI0128]
MSHNSASSSYDNAANVSSAEAVEPAQVAVSRYLQNAYLHVMALAGFACSREVFLHGLPVDERASSSGMMRAVHSQGKLQCRQMDLADLDKAALPCLAQLKGSDEAWLVIERYDTSRCAYSVKIFSSEGEGQAYWSEFELKEKISAELVSVFPKAHTSSSLDQPRRSGFASWMWQELRALSSVYRDIIAATLLINVFALAAPLFVMNVYDRVVPNQAIETLWVLASGLVLVIVFELLVKLLRHVFLEQAGKRLDLVLSSKLFSKVLNIRLEEFPSSVGSLASQVKEFDSIKQFFTAATMTALADVPFAIIFLLVIASVGGQLALVPLIAAAFLLLYGYVVHFPIKKVVDLMQQAAAEKNSVLVESLSGIETIKSLNAQGRQQGLWERALVRMSLLGVRAKHLTDSVSIVSASVMQLSTMAIVIVGVYQIEQQALSLGALIACVLLSSRALAPMSQIANLISQYQQARSALKGLDDLSRRDDELEDISKSLSLGGKITSIEMRDLSFSYSGGPKVLKDINLSLNAGEKVGIIGKIGSGKSSLLRLLLGFGRADAGQLLVNGFEVQHLNASELRSSIAYVPQEITLFSGSLRENILMKAPEVSQEALLKAVELSGLSELVQTHEMGLDMTIGEQGKGLSGGQRQCVAIARALINDPDLLLFDELSSSMDNQTEQMIINNIRNISKDKVLLLSTHRASLLALVDRIIVMDQGKIVADGPKESVLDALKRGLIQAGSQSAHNDKQGHGKGGVSND